MREASEKQVAFIRTLAAERVYAPAALTDAAITALTSAAASNLITSLLAAPRKPKAAAEAPAASPLADVEVSAYAIPTAGLVVPGINFHGDLVFLEVRMYKGHKFLNILTGSVGDFNRTRVRGQGPLGAFAAVIKGRHLEYARLFGEHFTCCGRCKSPLTDQKSREMFLGPDCRKVWGV